MTQGGVLRAAPPLTALLMAGPVLAGLGALAIPLSDGDGLARLLAWNGLSGAVRLSLVTGVVSTLVSLALALLIVAALDGRRSFRLITRALSPLLSVPHAAAALGLAFLISPSGWIARVLSPWATGWQTPPDVLILNDPAGLALILGLVVKETPFLLLMILAALPQADPARRMTVAASLGYGRFAGWALTVLPAVWPQIRLPVCAVLAYAMTSVEMALILGPSLPPTLAVQIVTWSMQPDLAWRGPAAAGAVLQLGLVVAVLAVLWLGERLVAVLGCRLAFTGRRGARLDGIVAPLAVVLAAGSAAAVGLGLAGLGVWSVAGLWTFPDALPATFTTGTWESAAPGLLAASARTVALAAISAGAALALTLACLEAEVRFGLRPGHAALWLLYLPLLVPQVVFLPGLHVLFVWLGFGGSLWAVAAVHVVFVLPYVFLSLAAPWRAWDARICVAGAALGAGADRVFWRLRLPMLLQPVLTALAIGLAVSIGQYLPTLAIGGGRVTTLTTEAVALSSGGNRRVIGTYAVMQTLLPAVGFALALALPALVFRNRRGMRGAT